MMCTNLQGNKDDESEKDSNTLGTLSEVGREEANDKLEQEASVKIRDGSAADGASKFNASKEKEIVDLGIQVNPQSKKRRIADVANVASQQSFYPRSLVLHEEALRKTAATRKPDYAFNQNNLELLRANLGRLQQEQNQQEEADIRVAQLAFLQRQHAALEARLQQQQTEQGRGMTGGSAQHQFGNFSGSSSSLFPESSLSLFGQQTGGRHSILGAGGGMISGLTRGSSSSLGCVDRSTFRGFGGFSSNQIVMANQLPFAAAGVSQHDSAGAANLNEDTTLTTLGLTSSTGRQLLWMQQALMGGGIAGGMLAGGQNQSFSRMACFGMEVGQPNFGAQECTGVSPASAPAASTGGAGLPNLTANRISNFSSSITPAGISHQALYDRDVPDDNENDGDSKKLVLYMTCDDDSLSAYQCLVRKQIELFEAREEDVESNAQGRNKPITLGQVGIRCRHCSKIPPRHRTRGATYYPAKLHGLYQAAQNMASAHLCNHCQLIPDALRQDLIVLRDRKSSAGGGKQYWADGVRVLGVVESDNVLLFPEQLKKEKSEKRTKSIETNAADIEVTSLGVPQNDKDDDDSEDEE